MPMVVNCPMLRTRLRRMGAPGPPLSPAGSLTIGAFFPLSCFTFGFSTGAFSSVVIDGLSFDLIKA